MSDCMWQSARRAFSLLYRLCSVLKFRSLEQEGEQGRERERFAKLHPFPIPSPPPRLFHYLPLCRSTPVSAKEASVSTGNKTRWATYPHIRRSGPAEPLSQTEGCKSYGHLGPGASQAPLFIHTASVSLFCLFCFKSIILGFPLPISPPQPLRKPLNQSVAGPNSSFPSQNKQFPVFE